MPNPKSCTHIRVTGVRCEAPALRGEQFCYFHQHAHRGVRRPPRSRLHPMALIESGESIQASLMEVINGLLRNTLDAKRAELILRALHIAVKNARNVRFDTEAYPKVRQVPEYAEPATDDVETMNQVGMTGHVDNVSHVGTGAVYPERSRRARPASKASEVVTAADPFDDFLPAVAAVPYMPVDPRDPHWLERSEEGGRVLAREAAECRAAEAKAAQELRNSPRIPPAQTATATQAAVVVAGKVHVGTAAPGCPSRAATGPAGNTATNAGIKVPPLAPQKLPLPARISKPGNMTVDPTKRKPSLGAKADDRTTAAPKERKNAAQRASAG